MVKSSGFRPPPSVEFPRQRWATYPCWSSSVKSYEMVDLCSPVLRAMSAREMAALLKSCCLTRLMLFSRVRSRSIEKTPYNLIDKANVYFISVQAHETRNFSRRTTLNLAQRKISFEKGFTKSGAECILRIVS